MFPPVRNIMPGCTDMTQVFSSVIKLDNKFTIINKNNL